MTSEKELFESHGEGFPEDALTEDMLLRGYRNVVRKMHQCPGDLVRGCGVWIPATRLRCYFCTKTIELRLGTK
jgi:hypothetical protein